MEVKEELLIDGWFGSCLLGFGFSSVRLDGRKVRISRRSSEIKQKGAGFGKKEQSSYICFSLLEQKKMGVGAPIDQATFVEHLGES
jgi:hypothetical protein